MSNSDNPQGGEDKNKDPQNQGKQGEDQEQGGQGADPKKTDNKPGEDQESKKTVPYSRFKEVNEKAKELDKLKKKLEDAENKKLEDQKKYKELADKYKSEKEKLETKLLTSAKKQTVLTQAQKLGFKDPEDAIRFVDLEKIEVSEAGEVEGVEDALKALAKEKAYLVGGTKPDSLGADLSPDDGDDPDKRTYKLSELKPKLQNREWYLKNEKWVKRAFAEGRVIDDVHK